ncbi:MAG: hypothetical protein Ct9H300mP11_12380 [Chloroflexota bacterium]|nr:MAG: hypothetical protein Ct9H300mP11_12380 [Chloroflexota bacterium]
MNVILVSLTVSVNLSNTNIYVQHTQISQGINVNHLQTTKT